MQRKNHVVIIPKESILNIIAITNYLFGYDWIHKPFHSTSFVNLFSFLSYDKFQIMFCVWKQQDCCHGLIPCNIIVISAKKHYEK